nr:MAG TPA: hypothetical protein [Caudoviricetes sp.]
MICCYITRLLFFSFNATISIPNQINNMLHVS